MSQVTKFEETLTPEEVGEFLRNMRSAINMTQKVFADELGIKQFTYYNYESGKHLPYQYKRLIESVRVLVKKKIKEGYNDPGRLHMPM